MQLESPLNTEETETNTMQSSSGVTSWDKISALHRKNLVAKFGKEGNRLQSARVFCMVMLCLGAIICLVLVQNVTAFTDITSPVWEPFEENDDYPSGWRLDVQFEGSVENDTGTYFPYNMQGIAETLGRLEMSLSGDWSYEYYTLSSDLSLSFSTNGLLTGTPVYAIYSMGPNQAKWDMDKAFQAAVIYDVIQNQDKWATATKDDVVDLLDIKLQTMPWDWNKWDRMIMSLWISLVFQFALLSVLASDIVETAKAIYVERKEGMKDLMSFLGLTPFDYWMSHAYTILQVYLPSIIFTFIVIIITWTKVDDKHDLGVSGGHIFYAGFSYIVCAVNTMLFTFAITSFMTNDYLVETYGLLLRSIIPFAFPVILIHSFNNEGFGMRFIFQFIPPINFAFALRDSLDTIHADTILFWFIDFFLWGYLTYYFDMTVPTVNGTQQKPCCFCFKNTVEESNGVGMENVEGKFLEVRNLTKTYGSFTAVDDLSFSLEKDQIYGLLGFNGAGKSTTISMITGMQKPSSGSVYIDGKNVAMELDSLRKQMGVCPQHNMLWGQLTVRAHLLLFGRLRGLSDEIMEAQMETLLEELEMSDVIDTMAKDLSGGQKRKLMVMQAFLGDPTFVLLDEPTAGVDIESRTAIHNLIIRQKKGKLIILTTHHMHEADMLSDYIAIMADGKIMEEGTATQLKAEHGSGTKFHLPLDSVKEIDLRKFDVTIEEKRDFLAVTTKNNDQLPSIVKFLETKADKLHIENNSLESVFLNLARRRAAMVRRSSMPEITVDSEFSVREIVSKDYQPAGMLTQLWLLIKKRAKILFYDPTGLVMGLIAVLLFVFINMAINLAFGMKNQPTSFPDMSELGSTPIYGTSIDTLVSPIKENLAQFGSASGATTISPKTYVKETPERQAFRVDGTKLEINVDPFYFPHAISLVSHMYTGSAIEVVRKDDLNFLSMIGPMLTAMMFCFATTLLMGAIYKYSGAERDSGMFNVQRLLGIPSFFMETVNLLFDWTCCIVLTIIYAATQANDSSEFGNMIVSWIVASFGFWYLVYAIGTFVDADKVLQAMGLLSLLVQIPIQTLNNVQPLYLQWITGVTKPPSQVWVLVKILFYFFPAFQFYASAILLSSKDNLNEELDIDNTILANHWILCWVANIFWILVYVCCAYAKQICNLSFIPFCKEPMDDSLQGATGLETGDDKVTSDMISKVYQDEAGKTVVAAREVTFVNQSGRCMGLLGKNGAGKSTMMKVLTTDIKQSLGKGSIQGHDIADDTATIRDFIGICNQENIFWDVFTAREHLTFFGTLRGVPTEDLAQVIEVLATELKFIEHLDTKCCYLSGGNKRKLSLCTSIMGCTRVLFLDEPSSGVDPFARDEMQRVLMEMKPGRCILFTSHTMEEAEIMCDDVVIMVKGKVECDGTIEKLIKEFSEGYFYSVDTSRLSEESETELAKIIEAKFPDFKKRETAKKELSYVVPFNSIPVDAVFEFINNTRKEFQCESVLESASLRELFRHVVNEDETDEESEEIEVANDENASSVV